VDRVAGGGRGVGDRAIDEVSAPPLP
jgi:hypothetical protein